MAHVHMNFSSAVLGRGTACDVILPERTGRWLDVTSGQVKKPSVLWLLHDLTDDESAWARYSAVERYANRRGLAVVMPSADRSYYANMEHGGRYFDFIADELPAMMQRIFGLSAAREDNYIAGAGMGGYGALRIGLANPDRYAAVGCISAGNTDADFIAAAKAVAAGNGPAPRIYHTIGTTDRWLPDAHETRDTLLSLDGNRFDYHYEELPGRHEWAFFDAAVARFITFALPE